MRKPIGTRERQSAKNTIQSEFVFKHIVGKSPELATVKNRTAMLAPSNVNVLFSGETGVGKELFARALHYLSPRSANPFVPVNCGALPTTLIENELFGHKNGAFTDARYNTSGLVSTAEGGTLFLDELEALSMEAQSKLLRLFQDRSFRPLGQTNIRKADVRFVTATNVDLRDRIEKGLFRQDLFYRLTIKVDIPPLRNRKTDIPLLARHFLKKYCTEYDLQAKLLSSLADEKLKMYPWPGNVRELENVVLEAMLTTSSATIPPEKINIPVSHNGTATSGAVVLPGTILSFVEARKQTIACFEKNYVIRLLMATKGNISKAAHLAEYDRKNFSRLIRRHDIDVSFYKKSTVLLKSQCHQE